VLGNWEEQIKKLVSRHSLKYMPSDHKSHLPSGSLKLCVYHGQNRFIDPSADIVLTTYSIITQPYHKDSKKSPLHGIHWYRIILDEGEFGSSVVKGKALN
jgi:SNF2 family DNA or RNA helicase